MKSEVLRSTSFWVFFFFCESRVYWSYRKRRYRYRWSSVCSGDSEREQGARTSNLSLFQFNTRINREIGDCLLTQFASKGNFKTKTRVPIPLKNLWCYSFQSFHVLSTLNSCLAQPSSSSEVRAPGVKGAWQKKAQWTFCSCFCPISAGSTNALASFPISKTKLHLPTML